MVLMEASDRAIGIAVARGLAIWFVVIFLAQFIGTFVGLPALLKATETTNVPIAATLILSSLFFLAAALFLWRNAEQFTDTGRAIQAEARPINTQSAVRLAVLAVGLLTTFSNAGAVVNFVVSRFMPSDRLMQYITPYSVGQLVMFVGGLITILAVRFGPSLGGSLRYPTENDLDGEDSELNPR